MDGTRIWLKSYPAGMPHDVDLDEYPSIVSIIEDTCKRFADKPAFENMGVTLSYAEIDRQSRAFASYLIHQCRLKKGDRVAIMLPNVLQYPVAIFGVLRAGMTVVNTNPMYTGRELKHQLNDSGAAAIVVLDNFALTLSEVISDTPVKHVIATGVGDLLGFPKGAFVNFMLKYVKKAVPDYRIEGAVRFRDALDIGGRRELPRTDVQPEDIAFLQYTGGTTGVSKGAMLTHRNLVANMQQSSTWIGTNAEPGKEHIITALPLYHIFALTANCLVFMKFGATNHLITNPRDMAGFCKVLQRVPFTCITGVNTLFNGLLNAPHFKDLDFSRLKFALGGGMAVQRAVAERWKQVTGCTLSEAYGLTETSPAVSMNPLDMTEYNGSIGLPIPGTEVSIQDEEFNQLAQGEIGELCVRGPQVMKGYWMRPEETAKVIDKDGWLHTGDMAKMDEKGFFFIVDRKKDMILVSGFNVYPNEIEDVVAAMPEVLEVAAVGVPDDKSGEAVKLVLVKKDPRLTADAVKKYCR
ncbi:MAG: AMP-binding protein, partial [Xanthomonadales bacterium]|nr:AMP-binding protein [Xanthomonadales bacterium]